MLNDKDRRRPNPSYMSDVEKAQYLKNLRSRPLGSRPPPPARFSAVPRTDSEPLPLTSTKDDSPRNTVLPIAQSEARLDERQSVPRTRSVFTGRPLVRPSSQLPPTDSKLPDALSEEPRKLARPLSMPYMERGTRWMEKQEVKSLRMALEDMDLENEKKIYDAARDEAAELVWKHQNNRRESKIQDSTFSNPDLAKDYRSHLRKGSYQRTHSQDFTALLQPQPQASKDSTRRSSTNEIRKVSPPSTHVPAPQETSSSGKSYGNLAEAVALDIAKAYRRRSGDVKRIMSGDRRNLMNPDDRIWEDPHEGSGPTPEVAPLQPQAKSPIPAQSPYVRKNPFARVRSHHEKQERSTSAPIVANARFDRVEIHRNPPSQSRSPGYTTNAHVQSPQGDDVSHGDSSPEPLNDDGKEIRGDDIRAATSKRRSDRSVKLPQPTIVSDKPGRPIVSFQEEWKPKERSLEEVHTTSEPTKKSAFRPEPMKMPPPVSTSSTAPPPPIPTLCLPGDDVGAPVAEQEDPSSKSDGRYSAGPDANVKPAFNSNRAQPNAIPERPHLSHHANTSPLPRSPQQHYTPSIRQSGILCAHCALPIAGRILSAAGQRLHPSCFACHQCKTNLELVAFYPEPENRRSERLANIEGRQAGIQPLHNDDDDDDTTLRFYCHLDFHELFSPRCKSCKTPIEGEVIVACGAEWHAGHFFCAQCGDPFDSKTPFVEKDGYAWCVDCHTHRYSSKCRKCRKPVTDLVIKALGSDWHESCFVCTQCNGEFKDGKFFLRGQEEDPVCVKCEERRLKA